MDCEICCVGEVSEGARSPDGAVLANTVLEELKAGADTVARTSRSSSPMRIESWALAASMSSLSELTREALFLVNS